MKGCVLLTVVWFIFCTKAGVANTTASTETPSASMPTEASSVSTPTEASSVSMPTDTSNVSMPTEASSVSTPTDTSNVSMPTEASSVSTPTDTSNVSMPTEASSVSTPTDTSNVSMPTETLSVSTPTGTSNVSMPTEASGVSTPTDTSSDSTPTDTSNVSMPTEISSVSMLTNATDAPTSSNATAGIVTTSGPPTCADQPCEYAAVCIDLFQSFSCQCPYGFYYMNTSGCQQGKVFPGEFILMEPYDQAMENIHSEVYAALYHNVTNIFSEIFKDEKSYQETVIISIKRSTQASKRLSKAEAASNVNITLINLFDINTKVTPQVWMEKVNSSNAIKFDRNLSQCAVYGCDGKTTICSDTNSDSHPTCECRPSLAKMNPEDKACLLCKSTECSPEKNQHCIMTAGNVPECRCQSGFQKEGDKCQECAFGYSGEDCKEVYLAALVGVSVACGVVIIVLIGVLIYKVIRRNKEPSLERTSLLQNDYSTTRETPGNGSYSNPAVKQRMFPRVQAGNPAEATSTTTANQGGAANKAYVPERDYDDDNNPWLEMSPRDRF
ncbi:mucin-13 [Podarcis raffonei]|uniref:mucin-13 n=1 Tax=Podarcis raffonei TaxID=65483 RepID=UPI0023291040|nr:mucin-13 [Podarcis raffonei]